MKKFLRVLIYNTAAIFLISRFIGGLSYSSDWRVLLIGAGVLTIVNFLIKPIIKIVTFPINLITLGLFSSLINGFLLYFVTYLVPKFAVLPFNFAGLTFGGVSVPALHLSQLWSLVFIAALISSVVSVLNWLSD